MKDLLDQVDRLFAAYNAKDLPGLRQILHDDLDMAHFNRNFAVKGADNLLKIIESFATKLMPNRAFEPVERLSRSGNIVVREAYWGGTPNSDIPGFGNAGQKVRVKVCSVLRFSDDGLLLEWKDYG